MEVWCALGSVGGVVDRSADHKQGFVVLVEMDADLFDFPEMLLASEQGAKARPSELFLRKVACEKRTPQPQKENE